MIYVIQYARIMKWTFIVQDVSIKKEVPGNSLFFLVFVKVKLSFPNIENFVVKLESTGWISYCL